MRRLLTGLLLAAALVGTAAAAQPARVLAVEWEAGGGKLRWVTPTTLRPVGPAVLNVGGAPANVAAVSPDRSVAALGGGPDGRLRFVRLDELRQTGLMRLGEGSVFRGIWAAPDRLVVLLGGSPATIVVVDPTTRRVVSRAPLPGVATGVARAGSRLVTLLTRPNAIGPARLAVIGGDGLVRTIDLPGIEAGWTPASTPEGIAHGASPGFASNGALAVVVGRESLVTVDLESLAVESRALVARSTAKRIDSWGRMVVWLGAGRIAISGWVSDAEGSTGIGVQTADLADGSMWTLDADATDATRAGSTLLVHGGGALHGYRLDRTLRFTILRGADTGYVQTAGRWAYVGSQNSTRLAVVDVQKGSVVGRVVTAKPTVLLSP